MNIKNEKLVKLITQLGEDKVLNVLVKKIEDDEYRREYHAKYNAKRNALIKTVKEKHPELFKTVSVQ